MDEYREVTRSIDVPANSGIDGFLRTLRQVLQKPRIQQIVINAKGKVSYSRYVREGEPEEMTGLTFDDLQPYYVIRNAEMKEFMPPPDLPAPVVIGMMFDQAAQDRLHPVAFVLGAQSVLWDWYQYTTGHAVVARRQLFGLSLYTDRQVPDTALVLCAAFGRDGSLVDTQVSYKVEMPRYTLPTTDVEVIS